MSHEGQDSISIANYLLERLSQIGVQARHAPLVHPPSPFLSYLNHSHYLVSLVISILVCLFFLSL